MSKIKVLFLAASPQTAPLRLDEEIREITSKIRGAEHRDSLEVISRWAVRPDDLMQALLEHQPHILHFSGHGSKFEELVLLDDHGNPKPVSRQALVGLLQTLKDNLRVVVLNACYSRPQAEAITTVIECAIGMKRAIGDEAAIRFAASFYRGLAFGRSVQTAFELGRSALMLEGIPEEDTPDLVSRVDPAQVQLITGAGEKRSPGEGDSDETPETSGSALVVWREKLAFLQEQEAVVADAAQKFALRKQIQEALGKIRELGG